MENKPSDWRESLWRRQLTAAERAALRAQPDLELEARLTESLAKIPDRPVASNFTAQVLQAVELEEARQSRSWAFTHIFDGNWRVFLPRAIATAAIMVFAVMGWQHYEVNSQRGLLARKVASVATTQPLPSVDVLNNFDVIQRMSQPVEPDMDLLALK